MKFEGLYEKTLVLIKPDAVQRGLIGEILKRFEMKGLKVVGLKLMRLDEAVLREHYAHISGKPFYPGVERFMMSSPIVALCLEGLEVVEAVRLITGVTKARQAEAGSIRGDLAMSVACNVIHTSDTVENARAEVARFFKPDEIHDYDKSEFVHVYTEDERV
ncbi:MAG: nucleoside-diphosphate kinase [Candidatus Magasanikbacteria bacterium RIFCSPHIGHO2_01_FULL_50_8]|uniref:Nucleoside diphosphate kinase n=2 Tax=Candidatus Magasanikiibacteriota TaxID=1752731 RepID=A0A1F6LP02_9BACT|nr:MAG: nucleoside-diphosphate kinase [Candidatus Magasanikbacteria bacterium RIFCSPHIGHO2_01_FULL_50_8]OGH67707.1 MAG: nucleoside-diphosphate kinase [Candidatus Magasanikbacteria bacterium RIFCSPHIGHO2_02_FULL_50_9b]